MLSSAALLSVALANVDVHTSENERAMIRQIEVQRLPPRTLAPFVNSRDPAVRKQAAQSLGRIQNPGGLPPLRQLLTDPEPDVRVEAAFAIGLIPGATSSLLDRLKVEDDIEVRAQIIQSLGRVCDRESCVAIIQARLNDEPVGLKPSPIRNEAAHALGRMAHRNVDGSRTPAIVSQLLGQLFYPNQSNRRAAAFALQSMRLSQLPESMALQLIDAALKEADPTTRSRLILATSHLTGHHRSLAALYSHAMNSHSIAVRISVARAAAHNQWIGVTNMLEDEDLNVRRVAIESTGQLRGLPHSEYLMRFLEVSPPNSPINPHCAAEALQALGRVGAIESFDTYLGMKWPAAVRSVAASYHEDPKTLVDVAKEDPAPNVRMAATLRLLDNQPSKQNMVALLEAEDALVVASAAQWFTSNASANDEAALLAAFQSAENPATIHALTVSLNRLYQARPQKVQTPDPKAANIAMAKRKQSNFVTEQSLNELLRTLGTNSIEAHQNVQLAPPDEFMNVLSARVNTTRGEIILDLLPEQAPFTVWNFVNLAEQGFFDGQVFHMVEPDFIATTGDPRGDGYGGATGRLPKEPNRLPHRTGTVSMATDSTDGVSSQWFIGLSPQPLLDSKYTTFAQVIAGEQYLAGFQPGDQIVNIQVERAVSTEP